MKKLSLEIFVERFNKKHNYRYDYSEAEYLGSKTKIKIILLSQEYPAL